MEDAGFGADILKQVQKIINAEKCDLFDVLEYIAYTNMPIARAHRARQAKKHFYPELSETQRDFIDFVLQQYVDAGVSELSLDKLPVLMEMKFGTAVEGVQALGSIEIAKETFIDFQKFLYLPPHQEYRSAL